MKKLINVVNTRKVVDQNIRPNNEVARLIRRIPCDGQFKNQFFTILSTGFSFSASAASVVDILITNE